MTWLDKLNRKFGKFALRNLMTYVVAGMALVFILDLVFAADFARVGGIWEYGMTGLLMFDRALVLQGQIWRLISFIFIPASDSIIFIIFSLYFYWMIGKNLEQAWGCFRFGLYYFCGIICTVISGFICGYATNTYLNLSLFLAFAAFFPNAQVLIFFILPVKIKWLAWLDAALIGLQLLRGIIVGDWTTICSIIAALANFIIFFGPAFINMFGNFIKRKQRKKQYNDSVVWGETQNREYWKNR